MLPFKQLKHIQHSRLYLNMRAFYHIEFDDFNDFYGVYFIFGKFKRLTQETTKVSKS